MKAILFPSVRFLLLLCLTGVASTLVSCTTTDPENPDMRVYPTAAEKNHQMQEQMSSFTRTLM